MQKTLSHTRQKSQASEAPNDELEVALVRLLLSVGFQHKRIAALFDCNQGRIAEIATGAKYPGIGAEFTVVEEVVTETTSEEGKSDAEPSAGDRIRQAIERGT